MAGKKIRLISWNVNGLRAVQRKGALNWFWQSRPDIICVQETKAQKEQLDDELINVAGYKSYFCSAEKKGYSGVAIYSALEPHKVTCGFGNKLFDGEGRVIEAKYDRFTLFNVYFPNGKASKERLQYKMEFYEAFLTVIESRVEKGENVVFCGDVNTAHKEIDLARPKENENVSGFLPEERAWMDILVGRGYMDTFRMFNSQPDQYTWWDMKTRARLRNIGWRIDYFFVNEALGPCVRNAFILPEIEGSDHCPIGIELDI
jgi:exodeoxyribonuclease-3